MTKETTEVSVFSGSTDLTTRAARVGQGSQNVSASDMAIPRIKLLQLISKEVIPGDPKYIDGAQAGMLFNSLTEELHTSMYVINLHFSRCTMVWKKRKAGGGMFGSFANDAEAKAALAAENEPESNYDISENPTHLVMIVDAEGKPQGVALLDMPGAKVKHSKKWNALIRKQEEAGNPRFGCVWQLSVTAESNSSGSYSNLEASFVVHAPDEIYATAEEEYDRYFARPAEQAA